MTRRSQQLRPARRGARTLSFGEPRGAAGSGFQITWRRSSIRFDQKLGLQPRPSGLRANSLQELNFRPAFERPLTTLESKIVRYSTDGRFSNGSWVSSPRRLLSSLYAASTAKRTPVSVFWFTAEQNSPLTINSLCATLFFLAPRIRFFLFFIAPHSFLSFLHSFIRSSIMSVISSRIPYRVYRSLMHKQTGKKNTKNTKTRNWLTVLKFRTLSRCRRRRRYLDRCNMIYREG